MFFGMGHSKNLCASLLHFKHLLGPGQFMVLCPGFKIPHSQHCGMVGSISCSFDSVCSGMPPILVLSLVMNCLASFDVMNSILNDFLFFIM